MSLALILDMLMIGLLALTIWFCWRLNGKIMALKESRHDLSEMVKTFDSAIVKTHKNVAELKVMSTSSAAELQLYINKAGELIEDLSFMTEAAGKLADRLEGGIAEARNGINQTKKIHGSYSEGTNYVRAAKETPLTAKAKPDFIEQSRKQHRVANDPAPSAQTPFARTSQDLLDAIRTLEQKDIEG